MRFAKLTFYFAGAWGVVVLVPLYFALDMIGRRHPPTVTHPEFYFAFLGLALVWQFAFFVIARDPVRFRPMMLPAIAEKFVHVGTMIALYAAGRMNLSQLSANLPDAVLGTLFVIAFMKTGAGRRPDGA
jgi:hypothetical protein